MDKNNTGQETDDLERKGEYTAERQDNMKRSLKNRHMTMIALGGTIGTGIFLTSGVALNYGGPGGSLMAYILSGFNSYFVLSALAEMGTYIPVTGSFNSYAGRFVDSALRFTIPYNYVYSMLISTANDLVAVGILMQFWFPNVHPIIWSAVGFVILLSLNSLGPRVYGEIEFWLAIIKVVAIIIFIIVASLVASGVIGGQTYGFSNWSYGTGPFVGGIKGFLNAYVYAFGAYSGLEIIGITAGESQSPTRDIPNATRTLFWRILLFYVLTIFLVGLIIPYDNENLLKSGITAVAISPIVLVYRILGVKAAPDIMNAVILSSIMSSANTLLFTTSRSLYSLACSNQGWKKWKIISKKGAPIYALVTCCLVVAVLTCLSMFGNKSVFQWLAAATSINGIVNWLFILFIHWRFRRGYKKQGYLVDDLPFVSFMYPIGQYLTFFLMFFILLAQGYGTFIGAKFDAAGFTKSYLGIPVFLIFYFGYKFVKKTKLVPLEEMDYETENYMSMGFENYRHVKLTVKERLKSFFA
ncbi:Lysine-specific permease [Smittium culicis]|uniref:Lysine-specific permease n=1 Tax=Smittium culicis TaxID=133412 RepID=A0A1R1YJN2_9FUNG|nr:Lysine-specific permease [Smittium culicis]